jgi:hypothetical protein
MIGMKHFIPLVGLLALGFLAPTVVRSAEAELKVVTDFEGASAVVTEIDQATKTIRFHPAGDAARGWPCWWYFRVEGITPGDTLALELSPSQSVLPNGNNKGKKLAGSWATPERATWSTDGKTWKQTEPGQRTSGATTYRQQVDAPVAWFAWGPPFTPRDSAALVERLAQESPAVEPFTLCQSRGGRACPAMRIRAGEAPDDKRPAVWIEARQHAWESGSSWVCRGVAEWIASDDPQAKSLRERADIYIVPIMDIDNTATGNGGKEAIPRDHNRDWTDQPHWNEVAAVQKRLKALADEDRLAMFIDLHNPGPGDKQPYFYVPPDELVDEAGRANRDRFLTIARLEMTGPLKLADQPRTSGSAYDPLWKQISKNWVSANCSPQAVSVTLETSWNTPHSTTDGYRTLGHQLGKTIERYLH